MQIEYRVFRQSILRKIAARDTCLARPLKLLVCTANANISIPARNPIVHLLQGLRLEKIIRIPEHQIIALRDSHSPITGSPCITVFLVKNDKAAIKRSVALQNRERPVCRAIVDTDDLNLLKRLPGDGVEALA